MVQISDKTGAYFQMHIAVILFGFTAILGDLIQLPALAIVWWRVLIACASLLFLIRFGKNLLLIPRRLLKIYLLIGIVVGVHWLTFYGAVKLSNASITLICMSTTSFFASLVEPLFLRRKIKRLDLFMGLLIVPSMLFIINTAEVSLQKGAWVAVFSAFLAAVFAVLNKKYMEKSSTYSMSFVELGGVFLTMSAIILAWPLFSNEKLQWIPMQLSDWMYLLILALLCTTLAWVISLKALKHISAFSSVLIVNLEPVYGIILAAFILKDFEQLNIGFYIGSVIILGIVLLYPILSRKYYHQEN